MTHASSGSPRFDVLIAADFTRTGDIAYRLSEEVRFLRGQGQRVGLMQLCAPQPDNFVSAEIKTCLRRGLATIALPGKPLEARVLVLHEPSLAEGSALGQPGVRLGQVAVVCHATADLSARLPDFGASVAVRTFVTNPALRALGIAPVDPRDWLPPPGAQTARPAVPGGRVFAVGWLSVAGLTEAEAVASLQATAVCKVPSEHYRLGPDVTLALQGLPDLSLDRMINGLDALVFAPAPDCLALPDTLVAAALLAGRAVILPRHLEARYGRGPIYAEPGDFGTALVQPMLAPRKRTGRAEFVTRARLAPVTKLASHPHTPAVAKQAQRPVLCLAANGVGIGHLTRLLAIARRISGPVVFATQAPAVGVVQEFGYSVHYLPSAAVVGGDFQTWDGWFKAHLDGLLDELDPTTVVYDGNHPSWGLVGAVAARRDCRLAWVRRGMWANTTSEFLSNARWCDLVIEPGDLAGARDTGVTARRRHEAMQINPIRLLDKPDLLHRAEAAALLGLNPARPAVLIQLGSGYNRDLLTLLDQIIAVAAAVPGLQIAVAEWVTGTVPLALWPQVTVLRGFPISQYIRAFDFCISAAGYNSFHEVIAFGVPTVFVANTHPSMDDQDGRAKFAQDAAAAFEISADDLGELPDLIALLMQDAARRFLTENCARFELPNGAMAAAQAIESLSHAWGSAAA